ncbi:hypothetical protein ACHAWF_002195, partial [Thalassiosira exigua]
LNPFHYPPPHPHRPDPAGRRSSEYLRVLDQQRGWLGSLRISDPRLRRSPPSPSELNSAHSTMQHPHNQHPPPGGGIPSFPPPPPPSHLPHPPLAPGWEQAIDPVSGSAYYANRSTGETSWTPPPPHFPPPPPPPRPVQMHPVQVQQLQPNYHPEQQRWDATPQPAAPQQIQISPEVSHNPTFNTSMPPNFSQTSPQQYPEQFEMMHQPNTQAMAPPQPQPPEPQTTAARSSSGLGPSTSTQPGLLVPSVRAMIEQEFAQRSKGGPVPKLELEGLSAGAIADLCNVSRELKSRNVDGGDFAGETTAGSAGKKGDEDEVDQYYLPLQPFSLPVPSLPPHIEPGRVDIRLHALQSKLAKI